MHAWKTTNFWMGAGYICAQGSMNHSWSHFAGRTHGMGGQVILHKRILRPEQSRGQQILLAPSGICHFVCYHSAAYYNGLVRCVCMCMHKCVCVCVCVCNKLNCDAWRLGRMMVSLQKAEVTRLQQVYNPITGLFSPTLFTLNHIPPNDTATEGLQWLPDRKGGRLKTSRSNTSAEEIDQRISGDVMVISNHMSHTYFVNILSSKFTYPVQRGSTKKLSCTAPVGWKKIGESMTQCVTLICLGRKVGIIFSV